MSETEPETTPDESTPDETETTEPTPDTTPDTDEDDDAEAAEAEAIARVKAASTAEIPKKIERAVNDQRKRLEKIIGVELEGAECPTCGGMGYTVGGADPDAEMVHPDNLVLCEKCNGYGEIITGSRNPQHATAVCIECTGYGYKTLAMQPTNVTPIQAPQITAQQAQMGTMMPDGTFVPFGQTAPAAGQ